MRVLWIGAGASIGGGYPPAQELISAMRREATEGVIEEGVRLAWNRFEAFRSEATGTERTLLHSQSPEVVLSALDLLEAALAADDDRIHVQFEKLAIQALLEQRAGKRAANSASSITPEVIEREYESEERRRLGEARPARDGLLHVLDAFFARRHHYDGTIEGVRRREYLRHELSDLVEGDVVVTTNWDTMIERTLLEDGRWSPLDGYGFDAQLTPVSPEVRSIVTSGRPWSQKVPTWPDWAPRRSAVRVLKIHGSFGWRTLGHFGPRVAPVGKVYLEHGQFLSSMPLVQRGYQVGALGDRQCRLWDPTEPEAFDPSNRPLYVYPSYLKQIVGSTLQDIWHEADIALRTASELRVLGASLPDADGAVRVLLNSVRQRVRDDSIQVTADDPSEISLQRWRSFLGDQIVTRGRRAGDI